MQELAHFNHGNVLYHIFHMKSLPLHSVRKNIGVAVAPNEGSQNAGIKNPPNYHHISSSYQEFYTEIDEIQVFHSYDIEEQNSYYLGIRSNVFIILLLIFCLKEVLFQFYLNKIWN